MAEKKKSLTAEEVKEAIEATESVPVEELRYRSEEENRNQSMDVFPELLARSKPIGQKSMAPTYGQIIHTGSCQYRGLDVAKILAEKEAEEKLRRERSWRRQELLENMQTAAAILLSIAIAAVCIAGAACLGQLL